MENLELRTKVPGITYEEYDKFYSESVAISHVRQFIANGKASFYVNQFGNNRMWYYVYVGEIEEASQELRLDLLFGKPEKETRGRKPKDEEVRNKTVNLRVTESDLDILDGLCASAGLGRWDLIKQALQEKYYDYNW